MKFYNYNFRERKLDRQQEKWKPTIKFQREKVKQTKGEMEKFIFSFQCLGGSSCQRFCPFAGKNKRTRKTKQRDKKTKRQKNLNRE